MRPLITLITLCAALVALPASTASAQGSPRQLAAQHTSKGDSARANRQHDLAITEYVLAYAYDPAPERLLNLARAFDGKGDAKTALALYKRVAQLAKRGPAADQARGRIAALGGGGGAIVPGGGTLTVMTIPPGGEVWVDGTKRGASPMPPISLPPGSHQVEVRLAGYQTWSKTVNVTPGQTINEMANLMVGGNAPATQNQPTTLTVNSIPAGSIVTLNGRGVRYAGPTATAKVLPGQYTLVVKRPGFADFIQMISVAPGQSPTVTVTATAGTAHPGGLHATPAGGSATLAGSWFGTMMSGPSAFSTSKRITLNLAGQGTRLSGKMVVQSKLLLRGYKRQQCQNAKEAVWETSYSVSFVKTAGGGRLVGSGGIQTSCSCNSICRSDSKMDINVFVSPTNQVMASEDMLFQRRTGSAIPPNAFRGRIDANSLSGRWHVRTGSVDENVQSEMTFAVRGNTVTGKTSIRKTSSLGWRKRDCGNRAEVTLSYNFNISGQVQGNTLKVDFEEGSPKYTDCPCKKMVCDATTNAVRIGSQTFRQSLDGNHLIGNGMLLSRK